MMMLLLLLRMLLLRLLLLLLRLLLLLPHCCAAAAAAVHRGTMRMSGKSGNRSLFHPMKSPNLFVMPKSPTVGWKWAKHGSKSSTVQLLSCSASRSSSDSSL